MKSSSVFLLYCREEGRDYITLLECKCALLRSLGVDVLKKELSTLLIKLCGWQQSACVTLRQFEQLHAYVAEKELQRRPASFYAAFDARGRGWIVEDDLYRVSSFMLSTVLCQLNPRCTR
jgi:hypothetical protein